MQTPIDQLLVRMDGLLATMQEQTDAKRHFLETYRRTTRAVQEELAAGGFLDPEWVERWDIVFAELYLDALEAWLRGEAPSEPWQVAFTAARDEKLPPLRHVLLGMNAHINYDLPLALLAVISDAEFADPTVVSKRARDHSHIDVVLMRRVAQEDDAISAASGGKSLFERVKQPLERRATAHFLREARTKVWANTHQLAAARGHGDSAEYERLRGELGRRSAAKLDQLARAREVILQLWFRGFGVLLQGATPTERS